MTDPLKPAPGTEFYFYGGPLHGATSPLPLQLNGYPALSVPFDVMLIGPGGAKIRRRFYYFLKIDRSERFSGQGSLFYWWGGPAEYDEIVARDHDWDTALEELS